MLQFCTAKLNDVNCVNCKMCEEKKTNMAKKQDFTEMVINKWSKNGSNNLSGLFCFLVTLPLKCLINFKFFFLFKIITAVDITSFSPFQDIVLKENVALCTTYLKRNF